MANHKKPFNKPAISLEEQCDTLIHRGMQIDNREKAIFFLKHTNYYRLEAYWLPYEISRDPHQFIDGVNFEKIVNHYLFDRELRLLLLDSIEKFEVSFRSIWAYNMSHQLGPHGYLQYNKGTIHSEKWLENAKVELKKQLCRSDEAYIKHYNDNYSKDYPPIWVACEVMSLGLMSRFYSNLRNYKIRGKISSEYQFDEGFLKGFLEHLTYVRNICAHHSRLWNRHLNKKMPLPLNKPPQIKDNIFVDEGNHTEHKIYNTLVILQHILLNVFNDNIWAKNLECLIRKYKINEKSMGFPDTWRNMPLWKKSLQI